MATRPLPTNFAAALDPSNPHLELFGMCDIEWPDGNDLHVFTGTGTYTYNSVAYLGIGDFGKVETVEETSLVEANDVRIGLSGVEALGHIQDALEDAKANYPVKLWLGVGDNEAGTVIDNPVTVWEGFSGSTAIELDANRS